MNKDLKEHRVFSISIYNWPLSICSSSCEIYQNLGEYLFTTEFKVNPVCVRLAECHLFSVRVQHKYVGKNGKISPFKKVFSCCHYQRKEIISGLQYSLFFKYNTQEVLYII